jgi:hypothetical protein
MNWKTDYELTIGGKLRKVYKNSGGFFVKMNGGNLDVNEYFLKNGGGLKLKYKTTSSESSPEDQFGGGGRKNKNKNKNKNSSKGKNKKKITGGYPISLITNNKNLQNAVIAFIDSIEIVGNNSLPTINFNTTINDVSVTNYLKDILIHIIKNFYINQNLQGTPINSYNVKTNDENVGTPIIINESIDYSTNIKNDILNFYKMYILYYFFIKYETVNDQEKQIVINNYNSFSTKTNIINVTLVPTQ